MINPTAFATFKGKALEALQHNRQALGEELSCRWDGDYPQTITGWEDRVRNATTFGEIVECLCNLAWDVPGVLYAVITSYDPAVTHDELGDPPMHYDT